MPIYLGSYRGRGTDDDPFTPDVEGPWSAIDLTPPRADEQGTKGRCLVSCDQQVAKAGRNKLADTLDERPTLAVRNLLGNRLGITMDDVPNMRRVLAHLLIDHGDDARADRWNRLRASRRRHEIWLGGELVWTMPVIRGGTTITESFDTANNNVLGPDLTWAKLDGDIDVVSNQAQSTVLTTSVARAETALATSDHYVQANVLATSGTAGVGVVARKDGTATKTYYFIDLAVGSDLVRILKIIGGSATSLSTFLDDLAADTTYLVRGECNGSTIKALRDGVEKLSITDTAITAGLFTGIRGFKADSGYLTWDNFEAGDLGGAVPTEQPIERASETETARAFDAAKSLDAPRAPETESARPVASIKSLATARASETETARSLGVLRHYSIGRVSEPETARSLDFYRAVQAGRVVEFETARSLGVLKQVSLSRVNEGESSRDLGALVGAGVIRHVVQLDGDPTTVTLRGSEPHPELEGSV